MKFIRDLFNIAPAEEQAKLALETAKRQMLHHEAEANYHQKMLEHYSETYRNISNRLKTF